MLVWLEVSRIELGVLLQLLPVEDRHRVVRRCRRGRVLSATVAFEASFILHASGWLEQARTVSFAKFRRD
ncbi:hypothetical protein [Mesorhizobium argentiipisi]|uniref:Transposase n=1 Tax=Mesorhizobium argentiipisi TaxID=3015175 RepID=A0ABU8KKN7_9HYPH